ncbi:hypothetical protein [Tolypothrix sp. VBCCA 56010]|uniref:hypothetical protein n=1 Tax=Tolypothrix sp. VBCCA 56010 TaxID=3137731 RepID=UPI003D7C791E
MPNPTELERKLSYRDDCRSPKSLLDMKHEKLGKCCDRARLIENDQKRHKKTRPSKNI